MKNGVFSVFIDSGSTYDIYYHLENNEIILTNTVYHVACVQDTHNFNYDNILACSLCNIYPGNNTFCEGVYRLSGSQTLVFADGIWHVNEETYKHYETNSEEIWERLREKIGPLDKMFKKTGVFMTGGQDSRLYLALMLWIGLQPVLYYGKGDSLNTCTKKGDEEAVRKISEKCGLPITIMDWTECDKEGMEKYIDKYGELFTIYRFNKNVFCEFEEKIDAEFLCYGYCGELYRNIETITEYKKDIYTLDEYVDTLYLSGLLRELCKNYPEFRRKIYSGLLKVCRDKEINPEKMTKGDFVKLNAVYRSRADMKMNNLTNMFCCSVPFLGDGEIISILENVDYREKEYSKFLMKGINLMAPELLEIPFFSHIKEMVFDKDTFALSDKKIVSKYKDTVRKNIKNEKLLRVLRKIYYLSVNDRKGKRELEQEFSEKQKYTEKIRKIEWIAEDKKVLYEKLENRTLEVIFLYDRLIQHLCMQGSPTI